METVTIVSHVRTPGPSHALEAYVAQRVPRLLAIEHQLIHDVPAYSRYRVYVAGTVRASGEHSVRLPEVARFIADAALTAWWTVRFQRCSDMFVGVGALNGFLGLLLRAVRLTRQSVFWIIDYSPRRFANPALNALFHAMDNIAALRSDETWNLAPRMAEAHLSKSVASFLRLGHNIQKVVPLGVDSVDDALIASAERRQHRLVFVGHILEKQGLQLVVDALPKLLTRFHDLDLVIVGDGPYLSQVRQRVFELGLEPAVTFTGFVQHDKDLVQILLGASIGLATYLHTPDTFTFFADPGKIKQYLAAGLPVCLTGVPAIAGELERRDCAIVVSPDSNSVADGLTFLLNDEPELERRRAACLSYASEISWQAVFDKALS
ncbi:MAG: glycosyltransferase [Acidimicrobiales bacterium]